MKFKIKTASSEDEGTVEINTLEELIAFQQENKIRDNRYWKDENNECHGEEYLRPAPLIIDDERNEDGSHKEWSLLIYNGYIE